MLGMDGVFDLVVGVVLLCNVIYVVVVCHFGHLKPHSCVFCSVYIFKIVLNEIMNKSPDKKTYKRAHKKLRCFDTHRDLCQSLYFPCPHDLRFF